MSGGQPGSEISMYLLGVRACPPPGECETLPEDSQGLVPRKSQGRESSLHFIFAAQTECNVQAAFVFLWAQWGNCQTVHFVPTIDLGSHHRSQGSSCFIGEGCLQDIQESLILAQLLLHLRNKLGCG